LALALALSFTACTNTAATTTTAAAQEEKKYAFGGLSYGGKAAEEIKAYCNMVYGSTVLNGGTTMEQWDVVVYDDLNSAVLGLERGDIDTLSLIEPTSKYVVAHSADTMEIQYYGYDTEVALSMAMLDSNTKLLEKLNTAIAALKEDGTLDNLEKEYLSDLTKLPEAKEIPTIEGAETIRVVITGDLPPFDYVTADGKAAGYNIALLSAIAEKTRLNIELVYANAGSRYVQLTSGKADVVFWTRGTTNSESAEFDFSNDLPQGMVVTEAYTFQWYTDIIMKN